MTLIPPIKSAMSGVSPTSGITATTFAPTERKNGAGFVPNQPHIDLNAFRIKLGHLLNYRAEQIDVQATAKPSIGGHDDKTDALYGRASIKVCLYSGFEFAR